MRLCWETNVVHCFVAYIIMWKRCCKKIINKISRRSKRFGYVFEKTNNLKIRLKLGGKKFTFLDQSKHLILKIKSENLRMKFDWCWKSLQVLRSFSICFKAMICELEKTSSENLLNFVGYFAICHLVTNIYWNINSFKISVVGKFY